MLFIVLKYVKTSSQELFCFEKGFTLPTRLLIFELVRDRFFSWYKYFNENIFISVNLTNTFTYSSLAIRQPLGHEIDIGKLSFLRVRWI